MDNDKITTDWLNENGFIHNWNGFSKYGYWKNGLKVTNGRQDYFYTIIAGKEIELTSKNQLLEILKTIDTII